MSGRTPEERFFHVYDLVDERRHPSTKKPVVHQQQAIDKLHRWFHSPLPGPRGGILVLPTGAGKTFTTIRSLCMDPLSEGYKVLWLAHTHHLLEQAFHELPDGLGLISEKQNKLAVRVVSGTPGHYRVHQIKPDDHVIIATLQTVSRAVRDEHRAIEGFLEAADGKLFVVFDEAHHSPAPSYRGLVQELRRRIPEMFLLGLTATPTYTEETRRGWLTKLFPQGILYEVPPRKLMLEGILAKPILEEPQTNFEPEFDQREYQKWLSTHRDLPEELITRLAESRDRNEFIASYYAENKERFGKTLIFADRWFQCEQISAFLTARGIRTATVYSHIDADPGSIEARNRRTRDDNAIALQKFRDGEVDVLLNVRMLTEGTDVPNVQTVFLTRKTTSRILLTQMVGRALRGVRFNGTKDAYIVSFIDQWRHLIHWAEYDQLAEGLADESVPEFGKRPPLQLISIELVQRLTRDMNTGAVARAPYLSLLPVGWYRVEYEEEVEQEQLEPVRELVLVFDAERDNYRMFLEHLTQEQNLDDFEREEVAMQQVEDQITTWQQQFFPDTEKHFGSDLRADLFALGRHVAQNGDTPKFFDFDQREQHDLDRIASEFIAEDAGPRQIEERLWHEFDRDDRLWKTLYPKYESFKLQCDACINRLLQLQRAGEDASVSRPLREPPATDEGPALREPSLETKRKVKQRDKRCLCCWSVESRSLQVDHTVSFYAGGGHLLENLQTLCRTCNRLKGTQTVNFRASSTPLSQPPITFPEIDTPRGSDARELQQWERFLRRTVNFFYQCESVHYVKIGERGTYQNRWEVELKEGNDPQWVRQHIPDLLRRIRAARRSARRSYPKKLTVCAPNCDDVTESVDE